MQLGIFNAIWSQIDFLVTILLSNLSKPDLASVLMMTGSATTAPRIAMLRRLARAAGDDELADICKGMGKLIGDRNHLSHGIWGWHSSLDGKISAACHFSENADHPIFASDLPKLITLVAQASHDLGNVGRRRVSQMAVADRPRHFYFGPREPFSKQP
jgi:hypothetical protein